MEEAVRRLDVITDGDNARYVEGMSGMTCVIPSWQILEVLNMPKFRERRVAAITQQKTKGSGDPKPESAGRMTTRGQGDPPANEANHNHREDFTRLLDAAVRHKPEKP